MGQFEKDMESRKEQGKVFTEDEIFMILNKAKKQDVLKRQKIEFIKIIDENNKKIHQLNDTNKLIKKILGIGE